ncbi:MAG TPA: malic enzyme-like NAD(P)-binding protein [Noviherbaspirillum sp.]|nr:malic enzyme-like NAD(P)-binding protein [Noviherbaspirillum sp.]
MDLSFKNKALDFHMSGRRGKIEVVTTKPVRSKADLALAYSPGVGAACEAITASPEASYCYTAKGNLIGVISNGSAVLGYGNIGPLAAKPVMEGKGILFKRFADIDVFDIEIDEDDPEHLVETIARISPTFGGINLEDIKAPECFEIERRLRERLAIPVFHDDQHGTAVVVAAAVHNALRVSGRPITSVRLVCSGAGAAAIASLDMLVALGMDVRNILVFDSKGLLSLERQDLNAEKSRYARSGPASLKDALEGADIFLGVSAANALRPDDIKHMNPLPLIMALANPTPEILPEEARRVRPDAMVCTGRSDYPNQVNNVLCFPYVFRAALDVRARSINRKMLVAAAHAIAELAYLASTRCPESQASLGNCLIPDAFDAKLLPHVATAVARAAVTSGVADKPIVDWAAYRSSLERLSCKLADGAVAACVQDAVHD